MTSMTHEVDQQVIQGNEAPKLMIAAVGPTFRAARMGAGVGVRALAERAEVSHTTISRWERGERDTSRVTYEHLSLALAEFIAQGGAA